MQRAIAEGRLDGPPGNNAIETYRAIAQSTSDAALLERTGVELSTAVWREALRAKAEERWTDAMKYLDYLPGLPQPPPDVFLGR